MAPLHFRSSLQSVQYTKALFSLNPIDDDDDDAVEEVEMNRAFLSHRHKNFSPPIIIQENNMMIYSLWRNACPCCHDKDYTDNIKITRRK